MLLDRGLSEISLEKFGGLATLPDRMGLQVGVSPDCQDVEFVNNSVGSRGGSSIVLQAQDPYSWNGLDSFVKLNGTRRLMGLQANGDLWNEAPTEGTLTRIDYEIGTNYYMKGATLFGREYLCFSDGKLGSGPPLQYDDTNLDRLSCYGLHDNNTGFRANTGAAGSVAAGNRWFFEVAVTRTGYVTRADAVQFYAAPGAKKIDFTNVATGASNVVARQIYMTPAGGTASGPFFCLPDKMTISDNTVTTLTGVDFTDAELISGLSGDELLRLFPLPEQAGVVAYHDRLCFWGGQPALFDNQSNGQAQCNSLDFDVLTLGTGLPAGWNSVSAGGAHTTSPGTPGLCWVITGSGAASRGGIALSMDGTAAAGIFTAGQKYRVRLHLKKSASAVAGDFSVLLGGANALVQTTIPNASIGTNWTMIECPATANRHDGTILMTLTLEAVGTLTSGATIAVDEISIVADTSSSAGGILTWSKSGQPEAFDTVTAYQTVGLGDGQDVRCCFVLRDNLYIAKERSLYVTSDNGQTEPFQWTVDKVSDSVGTYSIRGVGIGDGWVIIAARSGCYYFDGGAPLKLSQEIQPTWERINWEVGHTLWVVVDVEKKRFYVGVPLDDATEPSQTLVCDFVAGFGDPLATPGSGRKWAPWTLTGNSGALVERDNLTRDLFFGSNDDTGFVYKYDPDRTDDEDEDGAVAIDAYYETAPLGQKQGLTVYSRMAAWVAGAGAMTVSRRSADDVLTEIWSPTLGSDPQIDTERVFGFSGPRIGFRFGTNAVGASWSMNRFLVMARGAAWRQFRGAAP